MNIFQQDSYKEILLYLGKNGPTATKGFYRKLSEHLDVHPTFISQVLSGHRDFSEEQLIVICDYMGLKERETEFLLMLLKHEKAGSKRLRDYYKQQLQNIRSESVVMKSRQPGSRKMKEAERAIFYSAWQYSAVHMMATLSQKPSFVQIQARLGLSRQQTQQIVSFLLETEMIQEKNGKYIEGPSQTYLERTSPYLFQHHVNWRLKGLSKYPQMEEQELMYTSNFSISRADFATLRTEIVKFIQNFLANVEKSEAEDVGQLNIDLLWV